MLGKVYGVLLDVCTCTAAVLVALLCDIGAFHLAGLDVEFRIGLNDLAVLSQFGSARSKAVVGFLGMLLSGSDTT